MLFESELAQLSQIYYQVLSFLFLSMITVPECLLPGYSSAIFLCKPTKSPKIWSLITSSLCGLGHNNHVETLKGLSAGISVSLPSWLNTPIKTKFSFQCLFL